MLASVNDNELKSNYVLIFSEKSRKLFDENRFKLSGDLGAMKMKIPSLTYASGSCVDLQFIQISRITTSSSRTSCVQISPTSALKLAAVSIDSTIHFKSVFSDMPDVTCVQ